MTQWQNIVYVLYYLKLLMDANVFNMWLKSLFSHKSFSRESKGTSILIFCIVTIVGFLSKLWCTEFIANISFLLMVLNMFLIDFLKNKLVIVGAK